MSETKVHWTKRDRQHCTSKEQQALGYVLGFHSLISEESSFFTARVVFKISQRTPSGTVDKNHAC